MRFLQTHSSTAFVKPGQTSCKENQKIVVNSKSSNHQIFKSQLNQIQRKLRVAQKVRGQRKHKAWKLHPNLVPTSRKVYCLWKAIKNIKMAIGHASPLNVQCCPIYITLHG